MKYLALLLLVISCKSTVSQVPKNEESNSGASSKVEIFGDSLRVEYEYRGDTVIQRRIDLLGTSDDGFDNSFTIVSVWKNKPVLTLECNSKLKMVSGGLAFSFCKKNVIDYFSTDLENTSPFSKNIIKEKEVKLIELKDSKTEELKDHDVYLPFRLATIYDFEATNLNTNNSVTKLITEEYTTSFSVGKYLYFVNIDQDTIRRIHLR